MEKDTMSTVRIAIAVLLALALAACAVGKPIPQAQTYAIDRLPAGPPMSRGAVTLRVGKVRVVPAFAGKSLVARVDGVRYTSDFYHAFIAEPGELIGTRLAEWLDTSGPFRSVSQPGTRVPASHALETTVTELYGDFRSESAPTAVMTMQFTLLDLRGTSTVVALEQTLSRRVPLAESSPEALVDGYGEALESILRELAPELARAL